MRLLGQHIDCPWCVTGDFNEILAFSEKEGGAIRPASQIRAFQDALDDCKLFELERVGPKFTWDNGHKDHSWTRLRLDRAVANVYWILMFQNACCHTLFSVFSDHSPIWGGLGW